MPSTMADRIRMPVACPKCRQTLYAMARLRPQPRMGRTAVLLLVAGGLAGAGVYFALVVLLREMFKSESPIGNDGLVIIHYPPTMLLAAICFPVALGVGLAFGLIAWRLPKHRRLRCHSCHWTQCYPVNAVWESSDNPPVSQPATSRAQPEFQIVDDSANPWKEACAWAWAEKRQGKSPEQIIRDLVAQGWPSEDVERMVYGTR